jgi:glycosyltransferase involved in cell wall biosynthesis
VEDIFVDSKGAETIEEVNGISVIRSPIKNPPKKDKLARGLDHLSIYGHGAWSPGQFKHLLRDEFDIVHSTPFPSTHNYLAFLAASIRRKPFVCHPHLHLADAYHSDRRSLFAMMRRSAGIAANTTFERDYYIKRGISPRKLHVTGVGCQVDVDYSPDMDRPAAARAHHEYDKMRKLLFVGRKDPHKGIHDILNAMRVLTLGRSDILFVCVGPETDYSTQLWRTIPDELMRYILVMDAVSEREKHAVIQDSDMLILMSTTESFGIVLLEGWSHGKPVIGAKAGAIQSVIQDGVDGLLVEPGDATELAASIEFLLDYPRVGARLGQKGRAKTQEQFTWDHVAETWGRIFWEASKSE